MIYSIILKINKSINEVVRIGVNSKDTHRDLGQLI